MMNKVIGLIKGIAKFFSYLLAIIVFLIDRMTTEGTEVGKCNACQKWNVETLKLTDDGLVSLGLRGFDINAYNLIN